MNLKRTVDEIKKLQEEVSALRQENIQLKVRKREREREVERKDPRVTNRKEYNSVGNELGGGQKGGKV